MSTTADDTAALVVALASVIRSRIRGAGHDEGAFLESVDLNPDALSAMRDQPETHSLDIDDLDRIAQRLGTDASVLYREGAFLRDLSQLNAAGLREVESLALRLLAEQEAERQHA